MDILIIAANNNDRFALDTWLRRHTGISRISSDGIYNFGRTAITLASTSYNARGKRYAGIYLTGAVDRDFLDTVLWPLYKTDKLKLPADFFDNCPVSILDINAI